MRSEADAPADDPPGEQVQDERDVDEPGPGRDVGDVGDPAGVRRAAEKSRFNASSGRWSTPGIVVTGFLWSPATAPLMPRAFILRATAHRATGGYRAPVGCPLVQDLFRPVERLPHLAHPVHPVVLLEQRRDPRVQGRIGQRPPARRSRLGGVVGARGDRGIGLGEDGADRLDPELFLVLVDVGDQRCEGRSSSAAKKADALLRIAFARRSSRFSRSNSTIRATGSSVTTGARGDRPPATPLRNQFRNVAPRDPQLVTDLGTGTLVRQSRALLQCLLNHAHGALTQLIAVLPRCGHDSSLPEEVRTLHQTRGGSPCL